MASIDERVVAMSFENAKFEAGVAQTMATLGKLDTSLKNIGASNGLQNIEAAASKVTLQQPMSAIDKLKAKFSFGREAAQGFSEVETASSKVHLTGASSALDRLKAKLSFGREAPQAFSEVESASNKVTLSGANRAVEGFQQKIGQVGRGAPESFSEIERAGNRVDFAGLSRALDTVQNHFSVLEGAAAVALGNITSKAAFAGANFGKSFSFGPIKQGFQEYSTNLQSIQTILANTQDSGGNLRTVNAALKELNTYSDQTIYNFSEMAKNIGTFTAAGVRLKPATQSIKGIANLAALSGSNSQQASTAMYQLSQAIAAGKVGLQDWNSVVNAGMGGAVFQKALIRTGQNLGTIEKGAVKIDKATGKATINGNSFRESIQAKPGQKSWLTSDVLVKTLGQMTGDLTDAQLKAQGFTDAQVQSIQQTAKTAKAAATEVKTLPQVFDVARETIGSGWSQTFQNIFGDFGESKKTFTALSQTINGFINVNSNARNKVLKAWHDMGGRTMLIDGIKTAFHNLMLILGTVGKAFREVFPRKTGQDLIEMTRNFSSLMDKLTPAPSTVRNLTRTFAGVFAVLHIGWTIVKDVAKVFFDLLGVVGKGSGGVLNFTGSIGDFLVSLDKAISKGGALNGFFAGLTAVLRVPLELIKAVAGAIVGLFGGFDGGKADGVKKGLDSVHGSLKPLEGIVNRVKDAWKGFVDILGKFKMAVSPFFDKITEQFAGFGDAVADGLKNANTDKILAVLQTTFLGGIFLTIKKALAGGAKLDIGGGLVKNINGMFGALTGQLKAMQKNVQAGTLLKIAFAMGVLALSIKLLSTIDPKKMASAMTAIAVGLGELGAALAIMSSKLGNTAMLTMPVIATGMIGLAIAIGILALAMKLFATMSWEEIAKGLAGVAGSLTAVAAGVELLPTARMIPMAAGLLLIGVAMNVMAVAVKIFAQMKWDELVRGIVGLGGALIALGTGLAFIGPSVVLVGPGLIAASVGVTVLSAAVSAFGAIDTGSLIKGIAGLGAALVVLGLALIAIPPTAALQGAGLIVVAAGLTVLAGAIGIMGRLKVGSLLKGLIGMGGALVVLAVGLDAMIGTLPGAAALLAAAAAFAILGPALAFMGVLPWGVILKGLATMALTMGVIAVVGLAAAPALLAMGAALSALGLGLLLIGGAIYLAATGLAKLGTDGAKGIGVMVGAITAFVALLPTMIINFVKGLVSIADEVAKVAPKVVTALGSILTTVVAFIIAQAPKVALAVGAIILAIVDVLKNNSGPLISAGYTVLQNLLTGMASNIGAITTKAGQIITNFLNALASQAPRIIAAGARTLGAFLGAIATALPRVVASAARVVGSFLSGITAKLPNLISKAGALVTTFLTGIANQIPRVVAAGARIIVNYLTGIANALPRIISAGVRIVKSLINGIATEIPRLVDYGFKAVIRFLNGIASAIRANDDEMIDAGANIADALRDGLVKGLHRAGPAIIRAAEDIATAIPKKFLKVLGIHSPSTVMAEIGGHLMSGLALGIASNSKVPVDMSTGIGNSIIGSFRDVFEIRSPSEVMRKIGAYVGKGFANGLDGSAADIRTSFTTLNGKLTQAMSTARQTIASEQTKLDNLRKAKHPDEAAIQAAQKAINENQAVLEASKRAHTGLISALSDEKAKLIGLSHDYDKVAAKLEKAKGVLKDAIQTRDDAEKSYTDKYSALPTIKTDGGNQLVTYTKSLTDQATAVEAYKSTLDQLRALGLDDETYKKLLEDGTADQKFADQLLAGGKGAVDSLNQLDSRLTTVSKSLATNAAHNLYQAGVDAAQGLVDGLISKRGRIEKSIAHLADQMVDYLKKKLKIHSPSQEFADIGEFLGSGLVQGLESSSQVVAGAASNLGEDALSAMQRSISHISAAVDGKIELAPVVTPVMDLSEVEQGAKKLKDLSDVSPITPVVPITAAPSYAMAASISQERENVTTAEQPAVLDTRPVVNFEQNNYSPDPISNIELYRQTNNQLARIKDSVGIR